jgi:hypothetical protein
MSLIAYVSPVQLAGYHSNIPLSRCTQCPASSPAVQNENTVFADDEGDLRNLNNTEQRSP